MTTQDKDRIECAIRHIKTAVDVDPWAVEIAVEAMEKMLKDLPSVQPEIIRCKDCRFVWKVDRCLWCDRLSGCFPVMENDFCSFAKRRGNGNG